MKPIDAMSIVHAINVVVDYKINILEEVQWLHLRLSLNNQRLSWASNLLEYLQKSRKEVRVETSFK